jgi:hypothetical protein
MKYTKFIYDYLKNKKYLKEGITEEGRPDLKYYAFDWDDNICYMPTKIILMSENEEEVPMSTEEFAEHRHEIGVQPFNFKGTTIVGYASDPFRNFGVKGDKNFIIDSMVASPGPSWNDFVECINGGSIFAIITARGHNPETLKESCLNFILSNHNGINSSRLIDSLKKYRNLDTQDIYENVRDLEYNDKDLILEYLDLCKFHPVTFGEGSASNPEEGKIKAMREFISYCKQMATEVSRMTGSSEKAVFKNDVSNDEVIPFIGFSDDDVKNVEKMKGFLEKEYPEKNPVRVYLTKGGEKEEI